MILVKNTMISLNPGEQEICRYIAKRRFENNREKGVVNSRKGEQSDEYTDLQGFSGEFAFAKMVNAMPDFSIEPRSSDVDDGDLTWKGFKIDIKTTKYNTGKLIAATWKQNTIDIYILMVGEFPHFSYRGWMRSEELLVPERIKDLGRGPIYVAEQSELL